MVYCNFFSLDSAVHKCQLSPQEEDKIKVTEQQSWTKATKLPDYKDLHPLKFMALTLNNMHRNTLHVQLKPVLCPFSSSTQNYLSIHRQRDNTDKHCTFESTNLPVTCHQSPVWYLIVVARRVLSLTVVVFFNRPGVVGAVLQTP